MPFPCHSSVSGCVGLEGCLGCPCAISLPLLCQWLCESRGLPGLPLYHFLATPQLLDDYEDFESLENVEKSSYVLDSELWESKFDQNRDTNRIRATWA